MNKNAWQNPSPPPSRNLRKKEKETCKKSTSSYLKPQILFINKIDIHKSYSELLILLIFFFGFSLNRFFFLSTILCVNF